MCQKNCPSGCITLAGEKPEGAKKKVLTQYVLNFTTCSLCGLCVENCKPEAIDFSKEYNLASPRREDFVFDLMKRFKERKK
jgi:NADH-quinone oxidoreductase subunit I